MSQNNTVPAPISTDVFWARFLARQLLRAFDERGVEGVEAKLGEWGGTLTPSDVRLLLQLAGLTSLN